MPGISKKIKHINIATRKRLYMVTLGFVFLFCFGSALIWYQLNYKLEDNFKRINIGIIDDFQYSVAKSISELNFALNTLGVDSRLQTSLDTQDPDSIYHEWLQVYAWMHQKYKISNFSFVNSERRCLMCLHQPDNRGDIIDSYVLRQAESTGEISGGVEIGHLGTLSIRVVKPVFNNSSLSGYIILGKDIASIIPGLLQRNPASEAAIIISKKYLEKQRRSMRMQMSGSTSAWDDFGAYALNYTSTKNTSVFEQALGAHLHARHARHQFIEDVDGIQWCVFFHPVIDAAGRNIGNLILASDVTEETTAFHRLMGFTAASTISVLGVLLWIMYTAMRRTDAASIKQQQLLLASEKRLNEAQRIARIGNWEFDHVNGKLTWSDEIFNIFAIDPHKNSPSMEMFVNCLHPDDREKVVNEFTKSLVNKTNYSITHRIIVGNGNIKYVQEQCENQFDSSGAPLISRGTVQDVSTQIEAEIALVQSEQMLRSERDLFASGPVFILVWEPYPNWPITHVSKNVATILGYTRAEMMAHNFSYTDIIHPDDRDRVVAEVQTYIVQGTNYFEQSYRLYCKDGVCRWFYDFTMLIRDENSNVVSMRGYMFDQTLQKEASQHLAEQKQRLDNIIAGIRAGTWQMNVQSGELILNERWAEMIGYRLAELEPVSVATWERFVVEEDLQERTRLMQSHLAGETQHYTCEYRIRHRDGSLRWILGRGKVIQRDADNAPVWVYGTTQDITERRQVEAQLRKLSMAVEHSASIVVITDTLGTIEYVNHKFCETTGYTEQEALGQNPRVLKSGKHSEAHYANMWKTISAGKEWIGEFCNKRKDGSIYWEQARIAPVFNAKGNIASYIAIKEDITACKEAQRQLKLAKEKAEAANRAKSEFLANMSHEIRTPMNAIVGLSQLLKGTSLDDYQRDQVDKITTSCRLLLGVINNILDLSKIEAGELRLDMAPFRLSSLVNQMEALFAATALNKGLSLEFSIDPNLPDVFIGDSLRLQQILANLLSNAVKFTHSGRVELQIRCEHDTEHDESQTIPVYFGVSDSGIGINSAAIQHLFESFFQADTSDTREYGGTGLGLAISNRFVAMMGGKLAVFSEEGSGSTFYFTLGLQRGRLNQVEKKSAIKLQQSAAAGQVDLRGKRVLVVEDNLINQEVIKGLLKASGIDTSNIAIANDGNEALSIIQEQEFDLVFMDLQMPHMDGFEATMQIRTTHAELPIIALSAAVLDRDCEKAMAAGMNAHLAKPVDRDALESILKRFLFSASVPDVIKHEAELPSEIAGIDTLAGVERCRGDRDFYSRLLDMFRQQLEDELDVIPLQPSAEADQDMVRKVHTLKGLSAELGASRLAAAATHVDSILKQNKAVPAAGITELHEAFLEVRTALQQLPELHTCAEDIDLNESLKLMQNIRTSLLNNEIIHAPELGAAANVVRQLQGEGKAEHFTALVHNFAHEKALEMLDQTLEAAEKTDE